MKDKILSGFLLIFVIATSAFSVVVQDNKASVPKDEDTIIGTWRLDGELPANNTGHGFHWFLEYTLNTDGTFMLTGYPPLMQKGKYRVVKSEENKLTVDLYEQSGNFGTKDKQIEVQVDREKETLKIDGKEGFKPIKKKKQDG
ncbi:MAG: hypothetical protein ABI878_15325 [Acidobacteriota bacterium]